MLKAANSVAMPKTSASGRVRHLDGIRGIAILTVFIVHWVGRRSPAFKGGYIGVDIFFVLSGFIITALLLRRRPTYGRFLTDRLRRLYPPLLGALAGGVVLAWVWPESALSVDATVKHALVAMTQLSAPWESAKISPLDPFSMTWSLSIEWYFYLLWPLAVVRLRNLDPSRAARISLIAAGIIYVMAVGQPAWWFYYGPLARFAELLIGAAVAFWMSKHEVVRPRRGQTVSLVAALIFIAVWTAAGTGPYTLAYRFLALPLTVVSAVALIAAGYAVSVSPVVQLLSWRPLTTVGLVSYSLYLWHIIPIVLMGGHWMGLPMPAIGIVGLGLTIGCTLSGYFLLERPFSRSRGRELTVRTAGADTAARQFLREPR
jgi:peptidoglycan/LPS O-acetylase OafA/YrhL